MTGVLVLNAGSSSLKWTVFEADRTVLAGSDEPWRGAAAGEQAAQIADALARAPRFDAVGHRIVHGGARFRQSVVIDRQVRAALQELAHLDPEHMDVALVAIDAVTAAAPEVPQVAAFDTAFHATLPEAAAGYGLPFEWTERFGLRRFGFHGLSVSYAVERTRAVLGRLPARLVVCHLGSGCSVTAVADGRSLDTTMGFSPLEGLMMATRAGSVDPGLLLYLQERCGVGLAELRDALTRRAGLLGVSGVSGDLREVVRAADGGAPRAQLAYERFILSARRAVGAMAGALGGVDAVVFTGGIGERSARVRRDVCAALAFAGLALDDARNTTIRDDGDVAAPGAGARALVIRSREDLVILSEVLSLQR